MIWKTRSLLTLPSADVLQPAGGGRRIETEAAQVLRHRPDLSLTRGFGWSHPEPGEGGVLAWEDDNGPDQRHPHHAEGEPAGKAQICRDLQTFHLGRLRVSSSPPAGTSQGSIRCLEISYEMKLNEKREIFNFKFPHNYLVFFFLEMSQDYKN